MAKTIALNLTINGVKQSITNINQLEEAVRQAEEQLKGIEIGSEQFKEFSTQVNKAKGVLKDFGKSIEGQELEQRVGAFAKVGESITASFAGAQAAISLFGNESEAVAEAAAKAQAVLTIALAARSAAEGVVAVRTVAANIATYASAAAATAATTATRTLWATLAANPYGAIIAVIGLVVGALASLTSATDEQVNVQKELASATSDEANKLRQQLTILKSYNSLKNLQLKTVEDLKKEYPGFNAFLDKENKLTADGVKFIEARIKAYELESKAKLLIQKISEAQIQILELESTISIESLTFWQQAVNAIKSGGNVVVGAQLNLETAFKNSREQIAKINKDIDIYRGELDKTYQALDPIYGLLGDYNKRLEQQVTAEETAAEAKKTAIEQLKAQKEAYEKGRTALISFQNQLKALTDIQKQYIAQVAELKNADYVPKIIEDIKKIQEARKEGVQALKEYGDNFRQAVETVTGSLPEDKFLDVFARFRSELETTFVKGAKALLTYDQVLKSTLTRNQDLTTSQKDSLFKLTEQYKLFDSFLQKTKIREFIDNFGELNAVFDDALDRQEKGLFKGPEAFLKATGDIGKALGVYLLEFRTQLGENPISEIIADPQEIKRSSDRIIKSLREFLFKPTAEEFLKQQQGELKGAIAKALVPTEKAELEGRLETINKLITAFGTDGRKAFENVQGGKQVLDDINLGVEETIGNFKTLLATIITGEQQILKVNLEVQQLSKQFAQGSDELSQAVGGVILKNIDSISRAIFGLRTKEEKEQKAFIDKVQADAVGLQQFEQKLIETGVIKQIKNRQDLLAAFIEFKKKEVEVNKQAEEDKRKETEKTLNILNQSFQIFSQTLNQISAVQRERVQTDLDSLEIAQRTAIENVVGDSETAAKKRLEIEAEFQQKRKEIEKKAAIQSLQLSLVQSIAQAAQAIVNILQSTAVFGPAAPFVAAGLIGVTTALTAAQIAIISDQIANAQMMRRGGLLKAQSGMLLQGPSHEQGGIPLAQYGVVAEGNEAIINRQSSVNFRDLLSSINQSGGGRPLVVNNFDDSRIVEALAKQNQKPIRAYVLESEITNEQNISRRLDDLSKL